MFYKNRHICPDHPELEPIDTSCDIVCPACGLVLQQSTSAEQDSVHGNNCYSSLEKSVLRQHEELIKEITQKMYLLENIVYDAMYYFRKVAIGILRGNIDPAIFKISKGYFYPLAIASIILSVRHHEAGVRYEDVMKFCEIDRRKKVSEVYSKLLVFFNIKGQFQPDWFVERYCRSLYPIIKTHQRRPPRFVAEMICNRFIRWTRPVLRKHDAACVAALALWVAVLYCKHDYQLSHISDISGVSEEQMRKVFNSVAHKMKEIFPKWVNFNKNDIFPKKIKRKGKTSVTKKPCPTPLPKRSLQKPKAKRIKT